MVDSMRARREKCVPEPGCPWGSGELRPSRSSPTQLRLLRRWRAPGPNANHAGDRKPPCTLQEGGESLGGDSWRNQSQSSGQKERRAGSPGGEPESQETKHSPAGFPGQKAPAGGPTKNGIALVPRCQEPLGVSEVTQAPHSSGHTHCFPSASSLPLKWVGFSVSSLRAP